MRAGIVWSSALRALSKGIDPGFGLLRCNTGLETGNNVQPFGPMVIKVVPARGHLRFHV